MARTPRPRFRAGSCRRDRMRAAAGDASRRRPSGAGWSVAARGRHPLRDPPTSSWSPTGSRGPVPSPCRRAELLYAGAETLPAVETAVDGAPDALPVAARGERADPVVSHVRREHSRRDARVEREVRLLLERHAELLAVAAVVRAAGELDEAAAVVADAVAGMGVAEVLPPFVHLLEVGGPAELVDRREVWHLRRHGGDGRYRAGVVAEPLLGKRASERRPIAADVRGLAAEQRRELVGGEPRLSGRVACRGADPAPPREWRGAPSTCFAETGAEVVAGPTTPSAVSPWSPWNALRQRSVAGPKTPSTEPISYPSAFRRCWSFRT